jgi:hypothetical protein
MVKNTEVASWALSVIQILFIGSDMIQPTYVPQVIHGQYPHSLKGQ